MSNDNQFNASMADECCASLQTLMVSDPTEAFHVRFTIPRLRIESPTVHINNYRDGARYYQACLDFGLLERLDEKSAKKTVITDEMVDAILDHLLFYYQTDMNGVYDDSEKMHPGASAWSRFSLRNREGAIIHWYNFMRALVLDIIPIYHAGGTKDISREQAQRMKLTMRVSATTEAASA